MIALRKQISVSATRQPVPACCDRRPPARHRRSTARFRVLRCGERSRQPSSARGVHMPEMIGSFHPAVRTWFEKRFPDGPTLPQAGGWAEIAAGRDTLVAAPTGSGKTLAAFLVCIDRLYRACGGGAPLPAGPQVVYVSPPKAPPVD